jgi:dTDP-4-dehydrorhamnose reductase
MRILVTGGGGQLGRALARASPHVQALRHAELDVTDQAAVERTIVKTQPDIIIHAAALTDVDGCERDPEAARRVNVLGTRHVAAAAADVGAYLIYISTNFVFDGRKDGPYLEDDAPNPISVYGRTKLEGEYAALKVPGAAVVRASWIYGDGKRNFVTALLERAVPGATLRYLVDEVAAPTYAADLAAALLQLCTVQPRAGGIFHLTNDGSASAFAWAQAVLAAAGRQECELLPVPAASYPRPAARPRNGVLANVRAARLYGIRLRPWQDALQEYVGSLRSAQA